MCILLASTEHPDYSFILISNRDEYFRRPTEIAKFRPLNDKHVLCPADLGRAEHGTWIGINTQGKIAVLVNFRETDDLNIISDVSRGILPLDYLASDLTDDDWYENLEKNLASRVVGPKLDRIPLRRVGGFSLLYGNVKSPNKLSIISNRGDKQSAFEADTTIGLSNSLFYDPWPKVELGKRLLKQVLLKSVAQDQLVEQLFGLLSTNTFDDSLNDKPMKDKLMALRDTIFVPPLETKFTEVNDTIGAYYGTRTQTVILVGKDGTVNYYEKTLHDEDVAQKSNRKVMHYEFGI